MDTAKQAIDLIGTTERRLRELVGTAASNGEYDAAEQIMDWARQVGSLANGHVKRIEPSPASPANVSTSPKQPRRSTPKRGEYPRFFRRNDHLVKIGWSKKDRCEYEHKAPRGVVDALASAIAKRSGNGKLFTADDVFPLKNPQDGSEIPGYQAYLALAWLRSAGLVKQHGRKGYALKDKAHFDASLHENWSNLVQENMGH